LARLLPDMCLHTQGRDFITMRPRTLKQVEKDHIQYVLDHTSWNLEKTSSLLKISLPLLKRKIREYGLAPFEESEDNSHIQ